MKPLKTIDLSKDHFFKVVRPTPGLGDKVGEIGILVSVSTKGVSLRLEEGTLWFNWHEIEKTKSRGCFWTKVPKLTTNQTT